MGSDMDYIKSAIGKIDFTSELGQQEIMNLINFMQKTIGGLQTMMSQANIELEGAQSDLKISQEVTESTKLQLAEVSDICNGYLQ